MTKSALKFLTRIHVAPQERLIRQNTFATQRTQQRKRKPTAKVRPTQGVSR